MFALHCPDKRQSALSIVTGQLQTIQVLLRVIRPEAGLQMDMPP